MATKNGYSDAEVEALQKTGEAVPVEPKDGYSDDEVASLLKEGQASEVAPPTVADQIETAVRSTAEGFTPFGVSEPAVSGAIAIKNVIKQAVEQGTLDPVTAENFWSNYNADVQQRLVQKEQNPALDIGGQVLGALAPAVLTGGASLGIKAASGLAKGASALDVGSKVAAGTGKLLAKPLANAAAQMAEGSVAKGATKLAANAAEAAAGAVAQEAGRQGVLKSTGFMKPGEGSDLDDVAVMGAAIPVVGAGVGALARAAKVAGKGAMKVALGVQEEEIQNYMNNYEKLQTSRVKEEIEAALSDNLATIKKVSQDKQVKLTDDILDNLDILRTRVSKGSSESFDILGASNEILPTKPIADAIRRQKNLFYVTGTKTFGPEDAAAVDKIEMLAREAEALGPEVEAKAVKKIIQKVQEQGDYSIPPGQRDTPMSKAMKAARREIDQDLKARIPEYAQKMEEVSGLTSALEKASDALNSESKAMGAVKAVVSGKNPLKERALRDFAQVQPLEIEQVKQAADMANELNLLNEANIGDKLNLFVRGSNDPKIREQIEKLANLTDSEMLQELQALKAHEAFNKTFIRGSRNVNGWTVVGLSAARLAAKGAAGAIAGSQLSEDGAAIGAVWGATVDMFGPRMARAILKGIMQVKGIPTVAKIRALDIPEDAKRILIQDLARALRPVVTKDKSEEKSLNSFYAPEQSRPIIASEIRRAAGLAPEQKAEMINTLNTTGKVVDFDKVVFANEDTRPKQPSLVKDKNKKPSVPADSVEQYFEYKKRMPY